MQTAFGPVRTIVMMTVKITVISQKHALSGTCDASQLSPERPFLSITTVVLQLEVVDIRQQSIIPDGPRLPTTVFPSYLPKQHQHCEYIVTRPARRTILVLQIY